MNVTFAGTTYECTKAVRGSDRATLYLTEGSTVEFVGVRDWEAFSLEGGAWDSPDVTPEEQLRADVDYIAVIMGVTL